MKAQVQVILFVGEVDINSTKNTVIVIKTMTCQDKRLNFTTGFFHFLQWIEQDGPTYMKILTSYIVVSDYNIIKKPVSIYLMETGASFQFFTPKIAGLNTLLPELSLLVMKISKCVL